LEEQLGGCYVRPFPVSTCSYVKLNLSISTPTILISILTLFTSFLTSHLGGPKNVIPGALIFALFGAAGQAIYNSADARASSLPPQTAEKDLKNSWLNSKWSPMKVLTDKEYESMLREKLLNVEAEISLVDERIAALREVEREREMEAKEGRAEDGRKKGE
jgi:hypothetical protein